MDVWMAQGRKKVHERQVLEISLSYPSLSSPSRPCGPNNKNVLGSKPEDPLFPIPSPLEDTQCLSSVTPVTTRLEGGRGTCERRVWDHDLMKYWRDLEFSVTQKMRNLLAFRSPDRYLRENPMLPCPKTS